MTEILNDRFLLRGGLKDALTSLNEVPLRREMIIELDDLFTAGKFNAKIGDGVTHYVDLPYLQTSGGIESIIAGAGVTIDTSSPKSPIISSSLGNIHVDRMVPSYASLPSEPPVGLTTYLVEDTGLIYIWSEGWPSESEGIYLGVPLSPTDATGLFPSSGSLVIPAKATKWLSAVVDGVLGIVPFFALSSHTQSKFWRIYVTANNGNAFTIFGGVEMRATPGGATQCVGGTAFASSLNTTGWDPIKAFNGTPPSTSSPDGWATKSGDPAVPQFCGYRFPSEVQVLEITMRCSSNSAGYLNAAPKDFKIQSSIDSTDGVNGTWTDEWTVSSQVGWTAGVVRTFTRSQ